MINCILGLGSNHGDREAHLRHAFSFLAEICTTAYYSSPYESPAMSGDSIAHKPHYLNAVAAIEFDGDIPTLQAMLKACEVMEGRTAEMRAKGGVPLDMDVVIADGEILRPADFRRYFFRQGYEELLSTLGSFHSPKPPTHPEATAIHRKSDEKS